MESFQRVDRRSDPVQGEMPQGGGHEPTDNLMAFVERKLFTLNTGHIVTAYLRQARGYRTVREAIEDPLIRSKVRRAMEESGAVLVKRYGFDPRPHAAYIEKILSRFANPIWWTRLTGSVASRCASWRRGQAGETAARHPGVRPAERSPAGGHRRRTALPQ